MVLEPRLQATDDFELKPMFTQARHPAVENAVQAKLGHLLNTAEVQPGNLVQRIRIQSDRDDNGLMEIVFSDQDRRRASAIANAWADAYVLHAQATLNPSAIAQKLVDGQMREAKTELERREASLRAFEAGTGLGLPIRVDDATRIELSAIVGQAGSTTQMASSSTVARLGTRGQDIVGRSNALTSLRADLDRLRILKEQTRRLQNQNLPPSAIQLDLERFGVAANQPIGAVVVAIEAKELAMLSTIDGAARELRGLETGLIGDMNQHSQLERDRDIARDAYVVLAKKAEENKIGLASEWPVVRLFSYAPELAPVDPPPWTITLAIAGSTGLIVGVALGLGIDLSKRRRAMIAA